MKKKILLIAGVSVLAILVVAILIYTRPLSLSALCDGIELEKITGFDVTYEIYSDDVLQSCKIGQDDPRFLLLINSITSQKYRRSVWNIFPQRTRTHLLQDGDFRWELGCDFSDVALKDGVTVSGSVLHISDFYGKLTISFNGKTYKCSVPDQDRWIAEIMDKMKDEITLK